MKIMIELDEETYNEVRSTEHDTLSLGVKLIQAVRNGTPVKKISNPCCWAKEYFKGKCPYTSKECKEWRCYKCEVEKAEREQMRKYYKFNDGSFNYYINTLTGEKKFELEEGDIEVESNLDDFSRTREKGENNE